jgi:M-phase inducer tyrosine phosphatase
MADYKHRAQYIRQQDRAYNAAHYPKLTYPDLYILHGGYSGFFTNHRSRCYPQNYVEMDAKEHEQACERGLNKMRQRSKLSRAQTFAFGEHLAKIQESPSRHSISSQEVDMMGGRFPAARRMASY